MRIEEFLLARVEEAGRELDRLLRIHAINMAHFQQFEVTLHMQRELIKWHENWPILVEGPMEFNHDIDPINIDSIAYSVSRQMAWFTHAEYCKRFGIEPPSAPLLRKMAMYYNTHPDYNEEWRV